MHDWMVDAACAGANPEDFFEPTLARTTIRRYCRACPVTAECLEYARSFELALDFVHGIYGGLTTEERRAMRKHERTQAARRYNRIARAAGQ